MWLVPLLPFASFWVILFFGKRLRSEGHIVGIATIAASLVLSLVAFAELAGGHSDIEKSWTWFHLAGPVPVTLQFGMKFDFFTAVMFVVVTTISLLVQVYSTGYMIDDKRYTWFYAALSLFTASMLFLVVANNLLEMFVGWEGVGICSYLLIGHFWEEKENSTA